MRVRYYFAWLLMLLCKQSQGTIKSPEQTSSALLPLEARSVDDSGEYDVVSNSYVLPNQIFNDGKPYYARQDPVSGQLDFTAKKPAGIEPEANEVLNSKEKIVLNSGSTPNIHDFLNLPVKYSSSNFVYPLVSSSYANLKYQGSNKNYMTNKKPTLVVAPVTPVPPKYHTENYLTVTTTKLTAVTPTEADYYSSSTRSTTSSPPTRTSLFYKKDTSSSPTTTVRYTTTTRRPTPVTVSTTAQPSRQSTTRKKFVPIRKTSLSSTSTTTPIPIPSIPKTTANIPKTEQHPSKLPPITKQPKPTQSSSDVTFTTHHATPQAAIFPTEPTTSTKMYTTPSTSPPVVFTEDIGFSSTTPHAITLITNSSNIANLDPADVYHTLGQKNNKAQQEQSAGKPTMTLSDIFNSLAEEEIAVANNYQQNQGFDAQGNLIEPIAPSQPSPFAMQSQSQSQSHSQSQSQSQAQSQSQSQSRPRPHPMQGQQVLPGLQHAPEYHNDQKLVSGSLENYGNEYVSYQVQQPNVMQYRPIPGQINNVVISPGQHSASFVLGSQQQVSHPSNFGNVEKEALFSKDSTSVQYGQVINEDIGNIKRPLPPNQQQHQHQFPAPQQPTSPGNYQLPNAQSNTKFQTNINKAPVPIDTTISGAGVLMDRYPDAAPEAPTPYQQLPLIGSNLRPSKKPAPNAPNVISTMVSAAPSNQQMHPSMPTTSPTQPAVNTQDTKELLVSTNIRFPANDDDMSSSVVLPGPPAGPHINGHAQPLSLQQIQNANPVVFPKIIDEDGAGANVQIQQHEVLNINQHKQQLTFPAQQQSNNEQLTQSPSQEMEPPPRYPSLLMPQAQTSPAKHPNGPPAPPFYKEFHRKPQSSSQTGPRPNTNLPNILPQFRPNAKISNGHKPSFKQEPGNIRLPTQDGKLPYNPSAPPQFAHRRQPLQQQQYQKRYPLNRISEHPYSDGPPKSAADVNRRIYRLPPNGVQRMPQLRDRMYARRPNGPLQTIDSYPIERHAPIVSEPYKPFTADLDGFEEEDLVINNPPHSPNKNPQNPNESRLEAVVTLQMLQSQKKTVAGDDNGAGEIQVTADSDPQEANKQKFDQNNLYAVNLKTSKDGQNTIKDSFSDIRDSMLQQELQSAAAEYQNTPFSVMREQPQEPILKNKKPQSLQQQTKVQQLPKDKFPYPIEKPDPSYTELQSGLQVPGVLIAPRIINSAFSTGTESPIAIAYTPTEPNSIHQQQNIPAKQEHKVSNINYAPSTYTETQTEEVMNNDFDLRGQNFEKNFMAPFYPSVSLGGASGGVTGSPTLSNWKIVSPVSDQTVYEKNNINRADVELTEEKKEVENNNATNVTTEKNFEIDGFQPQLQGGFRPIYPPDYRNLEQNEETVNDENIESSENHKKPQALALAVSKPTPAHIISTVATTPSSVLSQTSVLPASPQPETTKKATTEQVAQKADETTAKTPVTQIKPTQPKKSTFETSLAALLFGDDPEYEDGARKSNKNEKTPAGPINVARMGPRSLVLR